MFPGRSANAAISAVGRNPAVPGADQRFRQADWPLLSFRPGPALPEHAKVAGAGAGHRFTPAAALAPSGGGRSDHLALAIGQSPQLDLHRLAARARRPAQRIGSLSLPIGTQPGHLLHAYLETAQNRSW